MPLLKKLKEWNLRSNFAIKKIKLYLRYLPPIILDRLLARKPADINRPIKSILLIRNDAIGDMVVTTGLIRKLSQAGYDVYVSSTKAALEMIRHNPHVAGTFLYNDSTFFQLLHSIKTIRKQQFDLAVELKVSRSLSIYYPLYHGLLKTNILLGFNQPKFRTFNQIINYKIDRHITGVFKSLLTHLNIENHDISYELFTNKDNEDYVSAYLSMYRTEKKFAIVNPLGSQKAHCLTKEQTEAICNLLIQHGYQLIITGESNQIKTLGISNYTIFPSRTILDIVSLIKQADLLVSVDTSVVHIATAFQIRTIALYSNDTHPLADIIETPAEENLRQKLDRDWLRFQKLAPYHLLGYSIQEQYDFFTDSRILWHPNNHHAIQIIVPEFEISAVQTPWLIEKISQALPT